MIISTNIFHHHNNIIYFLLFLYLLSTTVIYYHVDRTIINATQLSKTTTTTISSSDTCSSSSAVGYNNNYNNFYVTSFSIVPQQQQQQKYSSSSSSRSIFSSYNMRQQQQQLVQKQEQNLKQHQQQCNRCASTLIILSRIRTKMMMTNHDTNHHGNNNHLDDDHTNNNNNSINNNNKTYSQKDNNDEQQRQYDNDNTVLRKNNNNNNNNNRKLNIAFVTGNEMKMKEVDHILNEYSQQSHNNNSIEHSSSLIVQLHALKVDLPEIQEIDTMAIAKNKALLAAQLANMACIVEDTSLHFHSLGGMPGPYIKWFQDTLKSEGLYNILAAYNNKTATAVCTLAFSPAPHSDPILFTGECHGIIVPPEPGRNGFGWDSIFVPNDEILLVSDNEQEQQIQHRRRPFSQMNMNEKNILSHRGKAVRKFAEWLHHNQDILLYRQDNNNNNMERYVGHQGFKFNNNNGTTNIISNHIRRMPTSAEDSSPMIKAFPNEEYKNE